MSVTSGDIAVLRTLAQQVRSGKPLDHQDADWLAAFADASERALQPQEPLHAAKLKSLLRRLYYQPNPLGVRVEELLFEWGSDNLHRDVYEALKD